jgi:hypothetical protein
MRARRSPYASSELVRVAKAGSFHDAREPPLVIGNYVRLNSGGPLCTVVDLDGDQVTVGWPSGEVTLPRGCIHRGAPND